MDCSLPGSSVHGIFEARVLEWVAIYYSTLRLTLGFWQNPIHCFICSLPSHSAPKHSLMESQPFARKGTHRSSSVWDDLPYSRIDLLATISSPQDKKDFVDMRVKRLLKAGVTSALVCMVKADNAILTDQTKELLARCGYSGPQLGPEGPVGRRLGGGIEMARGVNEGGSHWGLERRLKGIHTEE